MDRENNAGKRIGHSIIGKPVSRLDAVSKVTGEGLYCDDMRLPGMLYGKILRSPHPHAKIVSIDIDKAKKKAGVRAVITASDTPCVKYGLFIQDETPLAMNKVRYIGDEVVALAAVDEETAEEALELIKVEYEVLPPVLNLEEAIAKGAPKIHDAENNIALHFEVERGNIEKGFEAADYIFEEEYSTGLVHPGPIEPLSCIASFDASGDLVLHIPLQETGRSVASIAKALGMPAHRIRITQPRVGGGFGAKNGIQPNCPITAFLAKKSGKPVKLTYTRDEEFIATRPAVPLRIRIKLGVTKAGLITAKQTKIMADNGAYSSHGPGIVKAAAIRFDSVYRQENLQTEADLIYTNNIPTGAYRGYGANQTAFALESLMDTIAEELNMDPIELRLKNTTKEGDLSVHGWNIRSCGLDRCIEAAAKQSGWKAFKEKTPARRGIGVALSTHLSGLNIPGRFGGSRVVIRVDGDGLVYVLSGEGESGQGAETTLAMIVAEELGVPLELVRVLPLDSQIHPLGLGAFSSRVTLLAGNAAIMAAQDVREKVLRIASGILKCDPMDLQIEEGIVYGAKDPVEELPLSEVLSVANREGKIPLTGEGIFDFKGDDLNPDTLYGDMSSAYSFAAHIAEVEVDPDTGFITVKKYTAAHDVGKVLNLTGAEGQVEGGVVHGIGYAIMEEALRKRGKIINPNFMDYKLPKATTIPEIKTIFIESDDPVGPFGAKGLGEEVSVPVAPAIANAIYDAIGIRIKECPITPEKILRELKGQIKQEQGQVRPLC
ncbi:xanthine dehydrogenase family protein molybdopterin-binding subunit [Thermodesulfobacteriota bacterium]